MKNIKSILLSITVILSIFFISGCASSSVTTINKDITQTAGLKVLYSAPDQEYEELGLVTVQTGQTIFHGKDAEFIINSLAEKAGTLGADAIIVSTVQEGKWGLKGDGTGYDRGFGEAIAIRFTEGK